MIFFLEKENGHDVLKREWRFGDRRSVVYLRSEQGLHRSLTPEKFLLRLLFFYEFGVLLSWAG